MSDKDLTAARLRELLHYDVETGLFTRKVATSQRHNVGESVGSKHRTGYLYAMLDRKTYAAHRLAWLYVFGEWPRGHIDHINSIKSDNRLCNLRDVDRLTNAQNERRARRNNKSSGLLGVSGEGGRFRALIRVGGVLQHLGTFETPQQAHNAYLTAKRELHAGCTI